MAVINSDGIPFDSAGDLIVGSALGIPNRLAIGSDLQVLIADSTQTTGVKWAMISGLSQTYTPVVQGGGSAGTATYTEQTGWYMTVGNIVFVTVNLNFNTFTGTGSMECTLPIAMNGGIQNNGHANCTFTGTISSALSLMGCTSSGGDSITLFTAYGSAGGPAAQACVAAAELRFSLIYFK